MQHAHTRRPDSTSVRPSARVWGLLFAIVITALSSTALHAQEAPSLASAAGTATASGTIAQPVVNLPVWPLYRQAQRLLDAQRATSADAKRVLGG